MEVILKSLRLSNFKGIKDLKIDFDPVMTNVYGKNNSGKTTIADAVSWLLFGKNSEGHDTTSFNVKTLDTDNNFIPKLEHEVEGVLLIDGMETVFKRILKQRWEKPNGETEQVYRGDTTLFFIDGIPLNKAQYEQRISETIDAELFRLITDPKYFNTLHWKKKREILLGLSPAVTDSSIFAENPKLSELEPILAKYKIDDFLKKTGNEITKLQKQLDDIPGRISELQNSSPEPIDEEQLKIQKADLETELEKLDDQLTDNTASFADYNKKQAAVFKLESEQNELFNAALNKFKDAKNKKENELKEIERSLTTVLELKKSRETLLASTEKTLSELKEKLQSLRAQDVEEQKKVFIMDEDALICPTCKKPLDDADGIIEQLSANFNKAQATARAALKNSGMDVKSEIAKKDDLIAKTKSALDSDNKEIQELRDKIKYIQSEIEIMQPVDATKSVSYTSLSRKIEALKADMKVPEAQADVEDIKTRKASISVALDGVKEKLASKAIIKKMNDRINELFTEEKTLSAEKAQKERLVNLCDMFTKLKMLKLEESVNSMFRIVQFKLFKQQNNGGEAPDCITLCNGVPYEKDLNNAAKVNVGLDIINTLCGFYNARAPAFIDNRESVTEIIPCDSQIINLIVSVEDMKLRVEAK